MNVFLEFLKLFKSMLTRKCLYESSLEEFILSNNPTDGADIERLTYQYNQLLNYRYYGAKMY